MRKLLRTSMLLLPLLGGVSFTASAGCGGAEALSDFFRDLSEDFDDDDDPFERFLDELEDD